MKLLRVSVPLKLKNTSYLKLFWSTDADEDEEAAIEGAWKKTAKPKNRIDSADPKPKRTETEKKPKPRPPSTTTSRPGVSNSNSSSPSSSALQSFTASPLQSFTASRKADTPISPHLRFHARIGAAPTIILQFRGFFPNYDIILTSSIRDWSRAIRVLFASIIEIMSRDDC
ncbi:hypothetical protein LXL04_016876 [Taraxacum kok-saghyz]